MISETVFYYIYVKLYSVLLVRLYKKEPFHMANTDLKGAYLIT